MRIVLFTFTCFVIVCGVLRVLGIGSNLILSAVALLFLAVTGLVFITRSRKGRDMRLGAVLGKLCRRVFFVSALLTAVMALLTWYLMSNAPDSPAGALPYILGIGLFALALVAGFSALLLKAFSFSPNRPEGKEEDRKGKNTSHLAG
jgi:hypothetical protein